MGLGTLACPHALTRLPKEVAEPKMVGIMHKGKKETDGANGEPGPGSESTKRPVSDLPTYR